MCQAKSTIFLLDRPCAVAPECMSQMVRPWPAVSSRAYRKFVDRAQEVVVLVLILAEVYRAGHCFDVCRAGNVLFCSWYA